jgi:dipeptidyl aminopeptidase/acylaminoacyl peptidase
MKRQVVGWILVVVVAVAANVGWYRWEARQTAPSQAAKGPTTSQPKTVAKLGSLEIEAIRNRGYQASPISITQVLGNQGGYTNAVVSFVSDSLTEYALQSTPTAPPPAGGYPVIILMHGYIPPTQYQTTGSDYHDFIAAWAQAGFVVIKPDYRGNGNSQGTATSGHYSPDDTYDMLNLIASLKQYSLVNDKRIGIFGHSLGGHIALNTAVTSPDVKATVLANGVVGSMYDLFYNWPNSPAPNDQPTASVTIELQTLLAQHGTPKSDPSFYNQASAINYVSAIKGSVQIDHDVGDTTVPFLFSQHLDAALVAAHKNVTFYSYPGDDHQFAIPNNHELLIQRTTAFFKANL